MFKEIRIFNITAIPGVIGMVTFINFLPTKFANTQFLFVNNLLVQTILRTSDYRTFQIIRESKIVSTLLFMMLSSSIMGLMALTAGQNHRYWSVKRSEFIDCSKKKNEFVSRYAQVFDGKKSANDSTDSMGEKMDLFKELIKKVGINTEIRCVCILPLRFSLYERPLHRVSFERLHWADCLQACWSNVSATMSLVYNLMTCLPTSMFSEIIFPFSKSSIRQKWVCSCRASKYSRTALNYWGRAFLDSWYRSCEISIINCWDFSSCTAHPFKYSIFYWTSWLRAKYRFVMRFWPDF